MSDYDAETGEILSTSAAAARVQGDSWARKRADDRGVGLSGLYSKILRAQNSLKTLIEATKPGARGIKYAPYEHCLAVIRPPFLQQGVLIRHGCERMEMYAEATSVKSLWLPVYTDLVDADSGTLHRTTIPMPVSQANAQAIGAAFSYGKRYTLLGAAGLATGEEDDDAESAMPRLMPNQVTETELTRRLKKEMDAAKTLDDLDEWAAKPENKKRLAAMSDDERAIVTPHWLSRRKTLSEAS